MARIVRQLGWHTPVHFISHDPRMRLSQHYGPYMISSALPLRYFDRQAGILDIWYLPAQWDESETIGLPAELMQARPPNWAGFQSIPPEYHGFYAPLGPDAVAGFVGLTAEEYGLE